ncbi:MAG: hypothetical protein EA427_09820 [Spirochaetaceae bacterium]|nr:MAG: hypothetical protein EA427_09820 [Spirochaetaceae bacterium]
MPIQKSPGTIHRTVTLLESALGQLKADVPPSEIERIAVMVHRGMSRQHRSFHTPEHIFALADPDDPHGTLAALFHDLVYYHVDEGFEPEVGSMLLPFITTGSDGTVSLARDIPSGNRPFSGCCAVFGFGPGQELSPFAGLNEFLSALVMALLFEGVIADPDLLIATACIEATIPFRRADSNGDSPAVRLHKRLGETTETMSLDLDEEDLEWAVIRAVAFANRDVRNFAEEDVGRFLDNTWKLLPETNPALRIAGVYTIHSYRVAVQKMRGFLKSLDPSCVFQRYRTEPSDGEYTRLMELTRRNLDAAGTYLGVKFLTASILEAMATLTGGDAPVALFMGEMNNSGDASVLPEQLVDHLPPVNGDPRTDLDGTVYHLLEKGRASSTGFDLQNAPLSLFVYRSVGSEHLAETIAAAEAMHKDEIPPETFLASFPPGVIGAIAGAAAEMVWSRRIALRALAERF